MFKVKVERKKRGKGVAGLSSLLPGPSKVKVGFPAGEADQDTITKAIWNNFGTKGGASGGGWGGPIPERPFMQNAIKANRAKYRNSMRVAARTIIVAVVQGRNSGIAAKTSALTKLGIQAQGDIQAEITSLQSPPNSPVTIELKGSSNPLIDSGELRNAVTFKVDGK